MASYKLRKDYQSALKGLDVRNVRYITNESVSEMMIYPALQKDKLSQVYSWLSQKFIDALLSSTTLIVLGYSFRDEDIRRVIIEAMYRNPFLWVILVSRKASDKKDQFFPLESEISSRIYAFNSDMLNAIGDRRLMDVHSTLNYARSLESDAYRKQAQQSDFAYSQWNQSISAYLGLGHHDRVRIIAGHLLAEKFTQNYPWEAFERIVGHKSLQYILRYRREVDFDAERWRSLFNGYYTTLEAYLVQRFSRAKAITIDPETLPQWANKGDFGGRNVFDHSEILEELEATKAFTDKKDVLEGIDMMLQTIRVLVRRDQVTWGQYAADDLGLRKWALRIDASLFPT